MSAGAKILVTRPFAQGQKTAALLKERGFQPVLCPMLEIQNVSHAFPEGSYEAFILTSMNAAQCAEVEAAEKDLAVFCVGDQLSAYLKELGFQNITVAPTVLELADLLAGVEAQDFLYLRGEDIRCDLAQLLPQKNIADVIVYKAVQKTDVPEEVLEELRGGQIETVLFYSVRSAQSFVSALEKAGALSCVQGTKALCLSPSVLESISVLPWKESRSALRPVQDALLEELLQASRKNM